VGEEASPQRALMGDDDRARSR